MNYGQEFRKYAVHHMGMSGLGVDDYMKHNVENLTPNESNCYRCFFKIDGR